MITTKCTEANCELRVDVGENGKTLTIIDVNKYSDIIKHKGSRCDFLILLTNGETIAAAVELKGGRFKPRDVLKKIQYGAKQIEDLSNTFKFKVDKFLPILLYDRAHHASQLKILRKVLFRGKKYSVIREECGGKLSEILDKSPD